MYSDQEKAGVWVKVAEAYLESDETDAADNFCNKVGIIADFFHYQ